MAVVASRMWARVALGAVLAVGSVKVVRYFGEIRDRTGLYKLGARYYDTSAGRFEQWDPSGQETNPYSYANCNPISGKDPSGMLTVCVVLQVQTIGIGLYAGLLGVAGAILALSPAAAAAPFVTLASRVQALYGAIAAGLTYYTCTYAPNAEYPGTESFTIRRVI